MIHCSSRRWGDNLGLGARFGLGDDGTELSEGCDGSGFKLGMGDDDDNDTVTSSEGIEWTNGAGN